MILKTIIPASIRLKIRVSQRKIKDFFTNSKFAKGTTVPLNFKYFIAVEQPIFESYLFENKIHNIQISIKRIESLIILPNQVFSFWKAIGAPTKSNNYREGRNLINGVLNKSIGGGLCQLSGILYHLSLMADLETTERYNHSIDIYKENERYSPLGADATVVYGYKDFRFKNNYTFPIAFRFELSQTRLCAKLCSIQQIVPKSINFIRSEHQQHTTVKTIVNGKDIKAISIYQKSCIRNKTM